MSTLLAAPTTDWLLRRRPWLRRDLHMSPSFSAPAHWMAKEPYTRRVYELDPLTAAIANRADGLRDLGEILAALRSQPPEGVSPEHITPAAAFAALRWLDERMLLITPRLPHWMARRGGINPAIYWARQGLFEVDAVSAPPDPADISIREDLRYTCLSCGACCTDRYRVDLLPSDLAALQALDLPAALGVQLSDCLVPLSGDADDLKDLKAVNSAHPAPALGAPTMALRRDAQGQCVFLREGRWCALHRHFGYKSKPYSCRSFPFDALMTPRGPLIRFRPECSSQHKTRAGGDLQAPLRAQLWADLTDEQPLVRRVPAVFPLNEQTQAIDYDAYLALRAGWVAAARAHGWRAGFAAAASDLLPTIDAPPAAAPGRPFVVLAQHLLHDLRRDLEPSSHTLDRLIPDAERDPLLWPTLLAAVGVVLPEHQPLAPSIAPLLQALRAALPTLDADPDLSALIDNYFLNTLLGDYPFSGLSILSGVGLIGFATLGARLTAAWMAARHGLPLDPPTLNESLIFWHMLLFDERPLRAHLLLRAISGLESLVLLDSDAR